MAPAYVDMSYKHKIYIPGEKPIDIKDWPSYNCKQMILNIGFISIWISWSSIYILRLIPRVAYFNGGCYWKLSFYWLKLIVEFSGPKKDTTKYQEITKEELDQLLTELE